MTQLPGEGVASGGGGFTSSGRTQYETASGLPGKLPDSHVPPSGPHPHVRPPDGPSAWGHRLGLSAPASAGAGSGGA